MTLLLDYSTREMQEDQRSPSCCSFRLTNLSQHGGVSSGTFRGVRRGPFGEPGLFHGSIGDTLHCSFASYASTSGKEGSGPSQPFGLKDINGALLFLEEVTRLILPVVICLSQRLSHACLSINNFIL